MLLMKYTCHVAVVRDGEDEPCDKPAAGVIRPTQWEYEEFGEDIEPYPACVYHLRKDRALTLGEVLAWSDARR